MSHYMMARHSRSQLDLRCENEEVPQDMSSNGSGRSAGASCDNSQMASRRREMQMGPSVTLMLCGSMVPYPRPC